MYLSVKIQCKVKNTFAHRQIFKVSRETGQIYTERCPSNYSYQLSIKALHSCTVTIKQNRIVTKKSSNPRIHIDTFI